MLSCSLPQCKVGSSCARNIVSHSAHKGVVHPYKKVTLLNSPGMVFGTQQLARSAAQLQKGKASGK